MTSNVLISDAAKATVVISTEYEKASEEVREALKAFFEAQLALHVAVKRRDSLGDWMNRLSSFSSKEFH